MLQRRHILNMKWRTAIMSAIILALFTFAPSFRSNSAVRYDARTMSRTLLENAPDEEDVTDNGECEDKRPDCDAEDADFKRELKVWFRCADTPEDSKNIIECPPKSNSTKRECNQGPGPRTNGIWTLKIDANKCRTVNFTCTGKINGGELESFIPESKDDPLFPPDAFTEEARNSGAFVFHLIGVLYMFLALALVCDHYFVPTLDVITEKYNISPDVAGATLMAAGGSAPELFTSIIGVFIAVSDVGIGTIVGSAVFNVLFVIAACAFASTKPLELTAWPLIRDTSFYSIALLMLVGFFTDDTIVWWEALILFIWYFCYVGFMKFNQQAETKFLEMFPSLKKNDAGDANTKTPGFRARKPLLLLMKGKVESGEDAGGNKHGMGMVGLKDRLTGSEGEGDNLKEDPEENKDKTTEEEEEPYKDFIRGGPGDDIAGKIMWYISLPLMLPMWATIPDPQDESRKKFFPLSFILSILWIAAFSYLMVWWATLVGQAVGISDAVMGLTFLAAGTSVPDLITSVLVARKGEGDMAVSSSIGSNLFDVTVGLPLPWLIYTAISGNVDVNSVGMGCNIGMLFLMLLIVFLSILAFKWKMTKIMGCVMLVMYAIFVVVSLGLTECWFACPF